MSKPVSDEECASATVPRYNTGMTNLACLLIGGFLGIVLHYIYLRWQRRRQREQSRRRFPDERLVLMGASIGPEAFLHVYAVDFQALSKSLSSSQGFLATRYYVVCHAIELALKAFLSHNRVPTSDLALTYRHDLKALLKKAEALGLPRFVALTNAKQTEIRRASHYYTRKMFEYPSLLEALDGYPHKPDVEVLESAAEVLIAGLYRPCREHGAAGAIVVEHLPPGVKPGST